MINWGIIGLGKIAHKFAADLALVDNARLHAVASRSLDRSKAFADQYFATYYFGSYEEIINCPDLHVVYIATPHSLHHPNTMMCLRNSIPVLCEKPFAMNLREAREMVNAARDFDVFLMEALWTRFLPTIRKILEINEKGDIGKVISLKADFGFHSVFDPASRLYNPDLGGGSLLDIGIYPVFLALLLFGKPQTIETIAKIGATGVDEDLEIRFQYADGRQAHLHSSIIRKTNTEAFIEGTAGKIHLHPRWHESTYLTLTRPGEVTQDFTFDFKGKGYCLEIEEVMYCLQNNKKESALLPLDFTLAVMETLDRIRKAAGISYPQDEEIIMKSVKES